MYDDEMKEIVAQFKFRGCRVSAHFYRPFEVYFKSVLPMFQLLSLFRLVRKGKLNVVLIKLSY